MEAAVAAPAQGRYRRGAAWTFALLASLALHGGALLFLLVVLNEQARLAVPVLARSAVFELQALPASAPPRAPAPRREPPPRLTARKAATPAVPVSEAETAVPPSSAAPPPRVSVPAAAAAASTAPEGEAAERFPLAYLRAVSRLINLHLDYPWRARSALGRAIVHVHLARDGRVLEVSLLRSSGNAFLDQEARAVVLRIGRFAPLPDEYLRGAADFAIDQPIDFRAP